MDGELGVGDTNCVKSLISLNQFNQNINDIKDINNGYGYTITTYNNQYLVAGGDSKSPLISLNVIKF